MAMITRGDWNNQPHVCSFWWIGEYYIILLVIVLIGRVGDFTRFALGFLFFCLGDFAL